MAYPSRHTHVAPKTKGRIQRHRWWRASRPRTCTPRQPRGDEARAVEFGRRQNHLRWGHRRSGLRLGVMEGHSDRRNGLPCVGSASSEVSVPARAYVSGTQASETASHSSQSERLFLSRIATGRPWPLAKNRTLGRPTRRPSDAVAGATPPIFIDGISQRGPGQGTPPRARVDIRREHPPAGLGVGAQTKSAESGTTDVS